MEGDQKKQNQKKSKEGKTTSQASKNEDRKEEPDTEEPFEEESQLETIRDLKGHLPEILGEKKTIKKTIPDQVKEWHRDYSALVMEKKYLMYNPPMAHPVLNEDGNKLPTVGFLFLGPTLKTVEEDRQLYDWHPFKSESNLVKAASDTLGYFQNHWSALTEDTVVWMDYLPFVVFDSQTQPVLTDDHKLIANTHFNSLLKIFRPVVLFVFGKEPSQFFFPVDGWWNQMTLYKGDMVVLSFKYPTEQKFGDSREWLIHVLKNLNQIFDDNQIPFAVDPMATTDRTKWAEKIFERLQTDTEEISPSPSKDEINGHITKYMQEKRTASAVEIFDAIKPHIKSMSFESFTKNYIYRKERSVLQRTKDGNYELKSNGAQKQE